MASRPLRVAADARCLNVQHLRGMGKSLFELVRRTARSGVIQWHLLGDRLDWPMLAPAHDGVRTTVVETRGFRFHTWEQWTLPRLARQFDVDVLHAPATSMPWWQPVPTVVTIHDVIPWQKQDAEAQSFYRQRLLPAAYQRASAILTISQTSRSDIVSRWPRLESRLHVVSPGVDARYLDAAPDGQDVVVGNRVVREPYLLYLGGSDPRKRLDWALRVWNAAAQGPAASLVVCGLRPDEHARVRSTVPAELHERLYLSPFVAEEDMPRLYMRASAVLYPTLYEGFGLPIIEAHAVGTPVLFCEVGSLAELEGPNSIVLPLDDLSAWTNAVDRVLQNRDSIASLEASRRWATQFSWDTYVDRTLRVYEAVARHRHRT